MAKNRNGPNRKYGKRIELRTEQKESNKIKTAVYRFSLTLSVIIPHDLMYIIYFLLKNFLRA